MAKYKHSRKLFPDGAKSRVRRTSKARDSAASEAELDMTVTDEESRLPLTSDDILRDRAARFRELFPEVFSDGRVNFELLQAALGDLVPQGVERYGLWWAGKADAIRAVQSPSVGALIPHPDASLNFDRSKNLILEGDNLEVLKLLQKSYHNKVKLLYIDPPYNTGKEFIYPDNFREGLQDYLRYSGQVAGDGIKVTTNTETEGRFHSKWLSMMWPRLFLARNLLRDDGVIFVSIDDHEVANLRLLLNELFGEENFLGTIVWKGATDNNPTQIAIEHEYVVCYARNAHSISDPWKNSADGAKTTILAEYDGLRATEASPDQIQILLRRFIKANAESLAPLTHYDRVDERGPYTGSRKVHNPKPGGYKYDVKHPVTGKTCVPPANGYRYPEDTINRMIADGRILFGMMNLRSFRSRTT